MLDLANNIGATLVVLLATLLSGIGAAFLIHAANFHRSEEARAVRAILGGILVGFLMFVAELWLAHRMFSM